MHILGLIAAVMGTLGMVIWRLHRAAEAAKGLTDSVQELTSWWRRWQWLKKAQVDPITQVDDPRVAAVAMMVAVAQSDGVITDREQAEIRRQITAKFEAKGAAAEEMIVYARWLVRDVRDLDEGLRKLTPVMRKLGAEQHRELVEMLGAVAAVAGPVGGIEVAAIERLERGLRLK